MKTVPISLSFCALLLAPVQGTLLTHYTMEETAAPLVDQAGGQTASAAGTGHLYSLSGQVSYGNAVGLNDDGSWQLSVADSAELGNLQNGFTVAAWVYVEPGRYEKGVSGRFRFDRIIGDDVAWDGDGWAFGYQASDGRLLFTKNGVADVFQPTGNTPVPEGEWVHLAATVSSTAGVTFYMNGNDVGTENHTSACKVSDDMYGIGRSNGTEQWFPGRLDEIRVDDTLLTPAEIQALAFVPRDPALTPAPGIDVASNDATTVRTIDVPIINDGETQTLNITDIQVTGLDEEFFTVLTAASPGSPFSIAPMGGSGTIQLSLDAGGVSMDTEATLEITSNDPLTPLVSIPISGLIRDPWISSVASVTVPTLTTDSPVLFDVAIDNLGAQAPLSVTGVFPTGTDGSYFTVVTEFTDPLVIAPGGNATVSFSFDPAGEVRTFSADLEFDSDDFIEPTRAVTVSAELAPPNPSPLTIRLAGNSFSGDGTGLVTIEGAPVGGHKYDNSAVGPSTWANFYHDSDGDQLFTSPDDTSGNTDADLGMSVIIDSSDSPKVLDFYCQAFANGDSTGVAKNFDAAAYRMNGLAITLSDGSKVDLDVTQGTPQTFTDPSGKTWAVELNGVGGVGNIVRNNDSVPGQADDYHFTLTFTYDPAVDFSSWAASFGIPNDENDDGDLDGIPALVEYGLGYDPTAFDAMPQPQPSGGDYTVTWPKGAQASADSQISYSVEISTDLEDWNPPAGGDLAESGTELVLTLASGQSRVFARISVIRTIP